MNHWLGKTLIHFPRFMPLNIGCSLATFGNTPKEDTKAVVNENKMKNKKKIIVYNVSTLKIKNKKKI